MESSGSKNGETCPPQLLDLMIPQEREWYLKQNDLNRHDHHHHHHVSSEEKKKLELRLGPPGDEEDNNWSMSSQTHKFSSPEDHHNNHHHPVGSVLSPSWTKNHHHSFLQFTSAAAAAAAAAQSLPVRAQESSQPKVVDIQNAEKKTFSPTANTTVPSTTNTSQKRNAPGPVVGWPPIRSFRKNLTNNSTSKLGSESSPPPSVLPHHKGTKEKSGAEPSTKFVKINMDGVPIGRKVDLKAYDSYEKLSTAVDELFRGLLAAQRDTSGGGIVKKQDEKAMAITGLLDGSGEYTLVYEDNEGDKMLVGDVPWHMFVSTAERLRVLKSSKLSELNRGGKTIDKERYRFDSF